MKTKLSAVAVRQAKAKDKPYKLTDGNGLYLLVNKTGKYWRYDYSYKGKRKTVSYGVYSTITLERARQFHRDAKLDLAEGVDPMHKRKIEQKEANEIFRKIAQLWLAHWSVGKADSTVRAVVAALERYIYPEIGDVAIRDLTAAHVRECIKKVEKNGAKEVAKRLFQRCSQIARYAVAHDFVERNVVNDLKPSDFLKPAEVRHYARIDEKELPELLAAIDGYHGNEHTKLALQLMSLTFVRTSELIKAEWSEFDLIEKRWVIPADRMKMKTQHIVPLSEQAIKIIKRLNDIALSEQYVFPSDINRYKHMSNNTILYALYRLGYRSRMTGHGFRGVASTILHENGFSPEHIELQLAHQQRNSVAAAYNHALYLKPRQEMMCWWANYLEQKRTS